MNTFVKEITDRAFSLSADEREKLALSLLQSTHNNELTENDREWIMLAEERFSDLKTGKDKGLSEADFFAQASDNLK